MEWKTIESHPAYQVSDTGLVKRVGGDARGKKGILKPDYPRGYARVTLHAGGVPQRRMIHHLVLEAFVGTAPEGHDCNHINGIKSDNQRENLEWVTPSENHRHRCRVLKKGQGVTNGRAKLTEADVRMIRGSAMSNVNLAKELNVSVGAIWFVRSKRNWAHIV